MRDSKPNPLYTLAILALLVACRDNTSTVQPQQGDLAKTGGSPTIRRSFRPIPDDPYTTNDESNDQPVGHFGTITMAVSSVESGNSYTLDADFDGTTVDRVYFPKGGWVDFYNCELDEELTGDCLDEEGRSWAFEGETSGGASPWVEEESVRNDDDESNEEDREPEGDGEYEDPRGSRSV